MYAHQSTAKLSSCVVIRTELDILPDFWKTSFLEQILTGNWTKMVGKSYGDKESSFQHVYCIDKASVLKT